VHALLLPELSWSWTVLLRSDIHRKPIRSFAVVLLTFVTYLLALSHIFASYCVWNLFILFCHHNRKYGYTMLLSFLTCLGSLSHHQVFDFLQSPVFICWYSYIGQCLHFFFNLHSGGWSPNWVHSTLWPFTGLLYLPWVIVRMENLVEWMAGETEVLRENLPRRHFSITNPTWPDPGLNPGHRGRKPATNRFSYGAATSVYILEYWFFSETYCHYIKWCVRL
jgi:hypothetical protein